MSPSREHAVYSLPDRGAFTAGIDPLGHMDVARGRLLFRARPKALGPEAARVFSFQFSVGESERSTLIDDDNEQVVGVPLATPVAPVRSPAEN